MRLLNLKYFSAIILFLLLAIGITVFLSQRSTDFRQKAAGAEWVLVGVHQFASVQTSAQGKMLNGLYPYNGKLYIAYGDAGYNTGPIHITHYDPASNIFVDDYLLTSDEIEIYRDINGKWYTPIIDRSGGSASYAVGEPWVSPTFTGSDNEHAYDLNTLNGTDLWLSTSHANGRIWRSQNNGETWSNVYTAGIGCQSGSAVRFRFIGVYKGKVYVQAHDIKGTVAAATWCSHPKSRVFNGSTWSDGPDLLPNKNTDMGFKPLVFANKMVYRSYPYIIYIASTMHQNLYAFDGTTVTKPLPNKFIHDFAVDGPTLYVLAEDGSVVKTTDLVTWTQAAVTAPVTARSIAVLNGIIYVGTTDARLYAFTDPSGITPIATPTLTPTRTPTPVPPTPTRTPTPLAFSPTPTPSLSGDINKDGRVDLLDFNVWRDEFLGNVATKQADLNNDGKVDLLDFNIWLTAYKSS